MQLAHFGHACVLVETETARILLDPGTLSTAFESLRELDAVVITHQHADHLDLRRLPTLLAANPQALLLIDAGSASAVSAAGLSASVVEVGDTRRVGGSRIEVVGGVHATVHADVAPVPNCGVLVDDGALYHPGDSYFVPDREVDVLCLPTSGPWLKVGEAVDFLRTVHPRIAVPIHEAALADTATHYGIITALSPAGTSFTPIGRATPTWMPRQEVLRSASAPVSGRTAG